MSGLLKLNLPGPNIPDDDVGPLTTNAGYIGFVPTVYDANTGNNLFYPKWNGLPAAVIGSVTIADIYNAKYANYARWVAYFQKYQMARGNFDPNMGEIVAYVGVNDNDGYLDSVSFSFTFVGTLLPNP